MDKKSGKLHPLMTVTALAVTTAALAILAVITGVLPNLTRPAEVAPGAAAATFSTSLAASPFTDASTSTCINCATVVATQPAVDRHGQWEVAVRMADGSSRLIPAESQPSWQVGQRVRISNGNIMSM